MCFSPLPKQKKRKQLSFYLFAEASQPARPFGYTMYDVHFIKSPLKKNDAKLLKMTDNKTENERK